MSEKIYDYLIVGTGLFGATFAYQARQKGKKCLMVEKRSHLGGNVHCAHLEGINVHEYGAHIFHTNDQGIWNFVNRFVSFNNYINSPLSYSNGKLYNLPFNMNTFYQIWGLTRPEEVEAKIQEQRVEFGVDNPQNLEEQALSLVGKDIYELLIKEYTEKQWGRSAKELPAFIIKRLPLRFRYDNNYFNDRYQGIPIGGYNVLIEKMIGDTQVQLNFDFFENRAYCETVAEKIVYTGKIDEYFDYRFGTLEYRSLRFEHELIEMPNYQGNAVINYNDKEVPFTRIIEHKHFEMGNQPKTIITREYPEDWTVEKEAYYPINNAENQKKYKQYQELSKESTVLFGGRLAEYKYYDMHQVIASALKKAKEEGLE